MSDIDLFRKQWGEAFDRHKEALRPGAELDWFAVDSQGKIACFITSGFALVPKFVFRDKEMLWKIYNYFYEEPKDYKVFSKSYSLWDYDVSFYSDRGLFCYDNPSDMSRPYEFVKSPQNPIYISELPFEIKQWLELLTFNRLSFDLAQKIDVSKYFESI